MANLPTLWTSSSAERDRNNWGNVLNAFLRVEHNADGTHANITALSATTGVFDTIKLDRTNQDVILVRDAANTLAQRNSTSGQTLNLYGTFSDTSNYERLGIFHDTDFHILTQEAGTGTARNLVMGTAGNANYYVRTNGTNRWFFSSGGTLFASAHNTYDIGDGTADPRNGNFGTAVNIASHSAYAGRTAYKSADESLNTSTTLQDDDELSVTLSASTVYAFKFWIMTNNANAAEGAKFALNGTVGVSNLQAQVQIADDTLDTQAGFSRITSFGSAVEATLSAGTNISIIAGTIETSTAGTFLLQWAQKVSGANNLTVQRGSYLSAERVEAL